MDETSTLRFDGCMATNVEQVYRHLEQVYEHLINPLGLSVLEWYALRALYREDGVSASHLAQLVCRHPSSMTALLDRMEEKDLLRRRIDEHDRRSVRVFLTERGRLLEPQIQAVIARLDALLEETVTQEELEIFQYVLCALQNIPLPEPS